MSGRDDALEQVIAASPVLVLDPELFVTRRPRATVVAGAFAVITDDQEMTVIDLADREGPSSADGCKGPYRAMRLQVATPFEAPGFIAAASTALGAASINVLVYSTFTFDYVLVRSEDLERALDALRERGFPITPV